MRELLEQGSFWPSQSQVFSVYEQVSFPLCHELGTLYFVGNRLELTD